MTDPVQPRPSAASGGEPVVEPGVEPGPELGLEPGGIRALLRGAGTLGRGFGFWSRIPGPMWAGVLPAAIVALVVLGGLIALGLSLDAIVIALTPFAADWGGWGELLRVTAGALLFLGAVWLAFATFTGLTLAVGDPFYERIWRRVEQELGPDAAGQPLPERGLGFWRSVGDAIVLVLLGLLVGILAFAVGFVPLVGGALGAVLGTVLTGRLLARELTSRAFEARGLSASDQRAMLPGHRLQLLGFGIATQLCFLVPLGAIVVMPAAVAGATLLARRMLDARPR